MAYCQVQMLNILPGRPPITTTEQAHRELVEELGNWIVNRRYDDRVKAGQNPAGTNATEHRCNVRGADEVAATAA